MQTLLMKYLLLLLSLPALTSDTCKNKKSANTTDNIPVCIQAQIDSIKKEPRWNPPAQVDEYEYNGKRVFLFSSDCCDHFNVAYDSNCQAICAPSGGITGRGDGKCADFESKAKHIKLVWKDSR